MSETTPTTPPLLDLDTFLARPVVKIDGESYELHAPDELSELAYHKLLKLGQQIDAIERLDDPTEAQETEYAALLDTLCRRILIAPPEIHAKLKTPQRAAVAMAFTQLRLETILRPAGADPQTATAPAGETTGAN